MKLTDTEIQECNRLLRGLDLPSNKREVSRHNGTYGWLQKNILTKNPGVSPRLRELLNI